MRARSRHAIAPVILIGVFAAIDACSGLERGGSSPLAEAGCHVGDALEGSDCESEAAGTDRTVPQTSGSPQDATITGSGPEDGRGDVADTGADEADTGADVADAAGNTGDVADTGGDVTEASSDSPGCFQGGHGMPGCGLLHFASAAICCAGRCVDPTSDVANCGSCGHACPAGVPCYQGACGCPLTTCGTACVNLQNDPAHCGACENVCAGAGRDSSVGSSACVASDCTCEPGQTVCAHACVDLTADPGNCGSCGHGCPAGCVDSVCLPTPQVLASGQSTPYGLAVDATSVYWTTLTAGTVMKVPLDGGVVSVLASTQLTTIHIAVNPTGVYFTTSDSDEVNTVMAMPVAGGTPVPIASGLPLLGGIAVDAANVYVTGGYAVVQIPFAGGDSRILAQPANPGDIAVDATRVYWVDGVADAVWSAALVAGLPIGSLLDGGPVDGGLFDAGLAGPPVTLASGQNIPYAIAVDSMSAYWVNIGPSNVAPEGSVMKVALGGGLAVTLASGQSQPSAIAIDSTSVYWTSLGDTTTPGGTVSKVPLAGGTVTRLAVGQGSPTAIAVDATSVYWVNNTGGTVMKVGK